VNLNEASNFPVQLTSFVGRQREIADLLRLLSSAHLVTLTGPGGCGKTRLALETVETQGERFPDGIWFVELAPLHEPSLVVQQVVQTLGLQPAPDQTLMNVLVGFVCSKQLLLILDNCEHLIAACAELAHRLLTQAAGLRILATSREALGITGEAIYPVSGLDWPSVEAGSTSLAAGTAPLIQYGAVRLFVERAQASVPGFELSAENAAPVIEICRRLDGLPLALELASPHVNVLSVHQIAAHLNEQLDLLDSSARSGREPRHQSLRAAIDWSYSMLALQEQILLRRLGVFSGGCTLELVEAVCAGDGLAAEQVLELLAGLVEKSLLLADTGGRTQARYRLLETIHAYALEKLEQAGETARLRDRHLQVFLARAEEAAPKLNEAYQQLWLNWLEGEHDNLRAALVWALASDRIEAGLRIGIAIVRFWEIRGHVLEALAWYERLLARADEDTSLLVRANALAFASFMAMFLGQGEKATTYGRKAVALAETVGDEGDPILILALGGLSSGARTEGDFATAFAIGEREIRLLKNSAGPPFFLGMALLAQGEVAIELGEYAAARAYLEESLAIAQEAGDAFRIAHAINSLGDLARCEQCYPEARVAYEQSAGLMREIGAQRDLASVLHNLGHTCLHLGEIERAWALFGESLGLHQTGQNEKGIAECLVGFAAIAVRTGSPAAGARLLGAATGYGRCLVASAATWHATQLEFEQTAQMLREKLGLEEFEKEMAAGAGMALDEAVVYALNLPTAQGTFLLSQSMASLSMDSLTMDSPFAGSLTGREREVAALVGQGKTNRGIASELVLSTRTVEKHVANILSKLGLTSRAQIVRWAMEHNLK